MTASCKILMVDNYDSFTYNLVHYLQQLDAEVVVVRNDQLTLSTIETIAPSHIVISPGPCDPDKAGLSLQIVERFHQQLPILGVCLGHQVIGQFFGGKIVKANQVVHGKTSSIYHEQKGIFKGFSNPFTATRYHSLVIAQDSLPDCLTLTAWTQTSDGRRENIMGVQHKQWPVFGVQFHPESVLSEGGIRLLENFVKGQVLG